MESNKQLDIGSYSRGIDYRLLFDSLPYMAFIKDKNHNYVYCNKTFAANAGLNPKDMTGMSDYDIFRKRLADQYRKDDAQTMVLGELPEKVERYNFLRTGCKGFARIVKTPVRDEDGNVVGVLGFAWDITIQHNMLEALRDSAEFNSSMLNNAPNPVIVINPDLSIRYVNRSLHELTGFGLSEIAGTKPPYPWWNRDAADDSLANLKESFKKEVHKSEGHFRNAAGEEFWVQQSHVKVRKNGRLSYYLVNWVDITESKAILAMLKTNESRVREYALKLALTEERERRRIATVIHDALGHELSFCKFKLDKVIRSVSSLEVRRDLTDAVDSISRAIDSARKLTSEISPPILWELGMHAALSWLSDNIQKNYGIRTRLVYDKRLNDIGVDLSHVLFQVARELVINVAKHSRARNCEISLKGRDQEIVLNVKDDGIGFSRSDEVLATSVQKGFGLLSIHERVSGMGGSVSIQSAPTLGTEVTIAVPR